MSSWGRGGGAEAGGAGVRQAAGAAPRLQVGKHLQKLGTTLYLSFSFKVTILSPMHDKLAN